MNICFLTCEYNIGGAERNLIDLVSWYQQERHKVLVLLPKKGDLSQALLEAKVPFISYGRDKYMRRWLFGLPIPCDLCKAYQIRHVFVNLDFRPDILHCNSVNAIPLGWLLKKIYRAGLYWTCHGKWEISNSLQMFFLRHWLDRCIAISPEIYAALKVSNKVQIPLGIKDELPACYQYISRKQGASKIICVARFQDIKGQDLLVRAFSKMLGKKDNLELHFYGGFLSNNDSEKAYYDSVCSYVKENGLQDKVFFHGFSKDVRQLMSEYDLVCVPSRYESFSIVILEALNRGLPVVAPDIGGPAYIIENLKSGLLFTPGDIEDLAAKCLSVLQGKCELESALARKRGAEFLIDKQGNRLLSLYAE